ncbi:MAG: hypothetical protein U1F76_01145 [Candidatus Competibacteraceae bacterium]
MKSLCTLLMIAGFALGLVACAPIPPVADRPPAVPQEKIWVVQHWEDAANRVAESLAAGLRSVRQRGQPLVLHVDQPQAVSPFEEAFHQFLLTRLLAQGFGLTSDPNAGLPLKYNVQSISHSNALYPVVDDELIVNVSVMNGDRYLSRLSEIYYIAPYDTAMYLAQGPVVARRMEVVGP